MDRIVDIATEKYPTTPTDRIGDNYLMLQNLIQLYKREGFIEGYRQAEKDLALTWQDIRRLSEIGEQFMNSKNSDSLGEEEYYKEILKRFLESRNVK